MTDPALRVGINLLWLRPGVVGGSEVAALGTVEALADRDEAGLALTLYAQSSFGMAHPDIVRRVPTRMAAVPGGSRAARVALEATWLPMRMRRDGIDLLHCYGGVVPPGTRVPAVLTLHDVQPLEFGAAFSATKRAWLREMIPRSLQRADAVVVPSQFVRERLLALLDVDATKIEVIPHGDTGPNLLRGAPACDEDEIRRRFRLDGPFVVFPAITYPHKNHRVLVEAIAELSRTGQAPILVLTGSAGSAESDLMASIERRGVADLVRRVGRVSDSELVALVRHAALVAYPSRYEGFGLPVLEAFAQGTPVAAAAAASLPEVVGDAGALIDPDDVAGWTDVLRDARNGAFASGEAMQRRRDRAEEFRWERIVGSLTDLYRRVQDEDRRRS